MPKVILSAKERTSYFLPLETTLVIPGLEACVGLASRSSSGLLGIHLTVNCPIVESLHWLTHLSPQGEIFIAGGMRGRAEGFISQISGFLGSRARYTHTSTDYILQLELTGDSCLVTYSQQVKTPLELQLINLHTIPY